MAMLNSQRVTYNTLLLYLCASGCRKQDPCRRSWMSWVRRETKILGAAMQIHIIHIFLSYQHGLNIGKQIQLLDVNLFLPMIAKIHKIISYK